MINRCLYNLDNLKPGTIIRGIEDSTWYVLCGKGCKDGPNWGVAAWIHPYGEKCLPVNGLAETSRKPSNQVWTDYELVYVMGTDNG